MKHSCHILITLLIGIGSVSGHTVTDLRFEHGDSAHFFVNRDLVSVADIDISGSHTWDMTVPFGPEKTETMLIAETDQGFYGANLPDAEWVAINRDLENGEVYEAYMGRNGNAVTVYGYAHNVTKNPACFKYKDQQRDSLYLFPLVIGKKWSNTHEAVSLSGDTTVKTTIDKEVVAKGIIITEVGNFPCVVLRTHLVADFYFLGIYLKRVVYYQYDWLSDNMGSLAAIRSRNGESREDFQIAERTQRIQNYWLVGDDEPEPGVREGPRSCDPFCVRVPSVSGGIKIGFQTTTSGYVRISCWDTGGRMLCESTQYYQSGEHVFSLRNLNSGVYFLKIKNDDTSHVVRCVVLE